MVGHRLAKVAPSVGPGRAMVVRPRSPSSTLDLLEEVVERDCGEHFLDAATNVNSDIPFAIHQLRHVAGADLQGSSEAVLRDILTAEDASEVGRQEVSITCGSEWAACALHTLKIQGARIRFQRELANCLQLLANQR